MAADSKSIEDIFRAARAEYRTELADWLVEIQQALEKISPRASDHDNAAGLERVRELAHKIAGSSGSFGLPDVSRAALPLEKFCIAAADRGEGLSQDDVLKISGLVGGVRSALEDHEDSP